MDNIQNSLNKICAIIPARGGSKNILRKNLRSVGGKPLIVRTLETIKQSQYINRLIVSTDDDEISKVAETNGSEVLKRSPKLSGDHSSSESVILDVLNKLKMMEDYSPNITVFLQCTSPFTSLEDIDGTVKTLIENKADSAFAASQFNHFLWGHNTDGLVVGLNHNENEVRKRRQDLEIQYLEAGSVYAFLTEGFLQNKNRFFGKISVYPIPAERVFEIDDEKELEQARIISDFIESK